MNLLNKFILLATVIVIANYLSGGFVWQQISKVDMAPAAAPAACIAGVYMASPFFMGLPIVPAMDDIVVGVVFGLVFLGILQVMGKRLRPRQKLLVFIGGWLLYKAIGYYLMVSIPGCQDYATQYSEIMSPLTPVFLIVALYALYILYRRSKK